MYNLILLKTESVNACSLIEILRLYTTFCIYKKIYNIRIFTNKYLHKTIKDFSVRVRGQKITNKRGFIKACIFKKESWHVKQYLTSFASTNVKLRLRFDVHLTFHWHSPEPHLTTWPSSDLPLTLTILPIFGAYYWKCWGPIRNDGII